MPQFQPADKQTVVSSLKNKSFMKSVVPVTGGVLAELNRNDRVEAFGALYYSTGWIVDAVDLDRGMVYFTPATDPGGVE